MRVVMLQSQRRASGVPWVSKSIHPRKFGNHVTSQRAPVRPSAPQGNQCLLLHFLASLGAQEKTDNCPHIAPQKMKLKLTWIKSCTHVVC